MRKELDYARKIETESPYAQVDASNLVNLSASQRKCRYKRVIAQITLSIFEETRRNCTEKNKMSKRNKEEFSKKDEIPSENKEKLHGEENDLQDNNEDIQKKQEGLLEEE